MSEDLLNQQLFDDEKIVTAVTLSRHGQIQMDESVAMLTSFYEAYKGKNGLWAVFTLSGIMEKDGITCDAVVLSKESDLEEKKSAFETLKSTEIFSLQIRDVEDLYSILASDMIDDDEFFRGDSGRAAILTSKVDEWREAMEKGHKGDLPVGGKSHSVTADAKPAPTQKKPLTAEKKPDLKKMFQKACTKEKTPKNSPMKAARASPFSSEKKRSSGEENSSPDMRPRRRARKIFIDDEDSCSPKHVESVKKEETPEKKTELKTAKKADKKKLDDGDLFDTAGSSPEKEEREETPEKKTAKKRMPKKREESPEKKKVKKETKVEKTTEEEPLRRSPRKHQATSSSGEPVARKKKVMRKVQVSTVDEDGFYDTKEVLQEVEVDVEPEETVKPLAPKHVNEKPAASTSVAAKKKEKAAPASQSKISSFFTRK